MAERKPSGDQKKPASEDESEAETKVEPTTETKVESKPEGKSEPKPPAKPRNIEERMEGVQGWMAELEKRQVRATRVGGAALVLAILAAGGALALGILNKQDAATTDDVDELTEKVNQLGGSIEQQTNKQVRGINDRLAALEQQLASLNERQRKAEADIAKLKQRQNTAADIAAAQPAPDAGGANDGGAQQQP